MAKYLVPPVVKAMLEEDLLELQKLAKSNADFSVGIGEITPLKIAIELEDWDFFYLLMLKDVVPKNKEKLSDLLVDKYRFSRIPCKLKTRFEFFMKVSEKYGLGSGDYYRVKNGCVVRKVAHDNRTFWFYDEFLHLVDDLGYFENKLKRLPSLLEVKQPNRRFRERTHLKTAVLIEDVKAVKFLLHQPQIQVNLTGNFSDYFWKSPLHLAVQTGNLEIVNLLLSHKDIDVNALDYEMKTPLIACLEMKERLRTEIKEILEEKIPSMTLERKKRRTIRLPYSELSLETSTLKINGDKKKEDPHLLPASLTRQINEEEDEEEDEEDYLPVLPPPRPVSRATQPLRYRMGYDFPESLKERKHILGSIDPDSVEADEKLEIYWIQQIEKEKQVLLEKVAELQTKVNDESIENALKSHPNICLKPWFYFRTKRTHDESTELRWFGLPDTGLHKSRTEIENGLNLTIACLKGNIQMVKKLLEIENIDLYQESNGGFPLHLATSESHEEIVSILLSHPSMNVNTPAHFTETRYDMFNDPYPHQVIAHDITPIALAKTPKIHQMIRDHPSFDLQLNMNYDGGRFNEELLSIPISELIPFFKKHESNSHIIPFINRQLFLSYKAKTTPLNDEELDVFKTLFEHGAVFEIQNIYQDDTEFLSLCLQYFPHDLINVFNQFCRNVSLKTSFSKTIRFIANQFRWEEARNLSKSRRRIPSKAARKVMYLLRVRPVEVWALNHLKASLNSNVMSTISAFLLE
jgi:ankyrin repeat protein